MYSTYIYIYYVKKNLTYANICISYVDFHWFHGVLSCLQNHGAFPKSLFHGRSIDVPPPAWEEALIPSVADVARKKEEDESLPTRWARYHHTPARDRPASNSVSLVNYPPKTNICQLRKKKIIFKTALKWDMSAPRLELVNCFWVSNRGTPLSIPFMRESQEYQTPPIYHYLADLQYPPQKNIKESITTGTGVWCWLGIFL